MNNFQKLQEKIKYRFKNELNLEMALSHPSLRQSKNYKFDYQRLEFLGDSVLNIVITKNLYNLYPNFTEGQLAQFRNYLISKPVIYKAAQKIDLHSYIIMTKGEEKSGGRQNISNIENTLEALIGAIYVDSQVFIDAAENFILNLWEEFFGLYAESDDPKTYIQNYSQSLGLGTPKYELVKQEGTSHSPTFTVSVKLDNGKRMNGCGHSIKEAQKDAARKLKNII
jgi:ribonuclease-3